MPKMSLEIHWASLNRVHVAGWKCCSAWPTAKTYVSGTLWSVCDLQSALGGQAKIYLRPIQKNLSEAAELPQDLTNR